MRSTPERSLSPRKPRSLEDYVEDGRTAMLVPPEDSDAMRTAIDRILNDPAKREQLARVAFDHAAAWTWDQYLAAVEALVGGGARVLAPGTVAAGAPPTAATATEVSERAPAFRPGESPAGPSEPCDTLI